MRSFLALIPGYRVEDRTASDLSLYAEMLYRYAARGAPVRADVHRLASNTTA